MSSSVPISPTNWSGGIAEQEFNDFRWTQYVFSELQDRVGLRGFICASKVFLVWPDQITLATGGEAVS
jgi:hypothetical protein